VGDAKAAVEAGERVLRDGVFVQAIRPPTVPPGTSRLRAVVTAAHSEEDVAIAVACLTAALRDVEQHAPGRAAFGELVGLSDLGQREATAR
jgi:H2-forming N5,N10-methylenetetrahydromethanopterin dehydrogenase-like enzyme